MDLFDPLTAQEDATARAALQRLGEGLVEGELAPDGWRDDLIAGTGREIFQARLETLRAAQPQRLQNPPASAPPGDRTSSAAFHALPTPEGPEFQTFLTRFIEPIFQQNHPLRPQMQRAQEIITLHGQGKVGYRDDILGPQFAEIARSGLSSGRNRHADRHLVVPRLGLDLIAHLARRMAPARRHAPMYVVSFIRLNGNPRSDHFRGYGLDLLKYGGHRIHMEDPDEAFAGVLEVIEALPPGRYQLGLPRVPETRRYPYSPPPDEDFDLTATFSRSGELGAPAARTRDRQQFRQFYTIHGDLRPEYRASATDNRWGLPNPFLDRRLREGHSPGGIERDRQVWEDVSYANRFFAAVHHASSNGALVEDVFPDKPNHLHISILH